VRYPEDMIRCLRVWMLLAVVAACPHLGAQGGIRDMALTVRSTAIEPGGSIPRQYTCDGRDLSPPLRWDNVPEGTRSFALICEDPDAPSGIWVHWVIYGIPGKTRQLPEGVAPDARLSDGSLQGKNDFGRLGYGGPCPPRGKPHRYFFRLYALEGSLSLEPGLSRNALLARIQGHVLAEAELYGTYGRQ
jgi:Raf kinase inhibitor-like YbhB/YbcL family protein